jgi:hypothetical protein|tara:strand:+ start:535 stop:870 length:336 start_codon:yes stop_codon:yes gene_type:complete
MIDTDKHEETIKVYEFRKRELMIYTDRNEQHPLGEYKFRQKDWQVRRFINDAIHAGWTLSSMKEIYDEAMEEVKRLREGIKKALIPTDKVPWTHPMVKLDDLRDVLKGLIE